MSLLNEYTFVKGEVPRFNYNDEAGLNLVKDQVPVILTGSDLVATAMKWDLKYLSEHLGSGSFAVYLNRLTENKSTDDNENDRVSPQENHKSEGFKSKKRKMKRHNIFKYYDEKKLNDYKGVFVPEMIRQDIPFEDFLQKFYGDRSSERIYLQQPLNNTVGRQIAADFVGFNWSWEVERQKEWNWGPLTSNLLLIGQEGNITPCHYDEQQNLFCQLKGRKRILMFPPEHFPCLYPYPVFHPHDRQSQVDIDYPDLKRFPKFSEAKALDAIVSPGEILYIPMYWWHHVINLDDTIAINFWHKAGATSPIEYPLTATQKVAMSRNTEKMLLEALQDQDELSEVLHWIVDGRF